MGLNNNQQVLTFDYTKRPDVTKLNDDKVIAKRDEKSLINVSLFKFFFLSYVFILLVFEQVDQVFKYMLQKGTFVAGCFLISNSTKLTASFKVTLFPKSMGWSKIYIAVVVNHTFSKQNFKALSHNFIIISFAIYFFHPA